MNKQKRKKALRRQTKRCFNALILAPRLSRIGSFLFYEETQDFHEYVKLMYQNACRTCRTNICPVI